MHYDAYAFAKNPRKPTIVSRKPGAVLGQRKGFSEVKLASRFAQRSTDQYTIYLRLSHCACRLIRRNWIDFTSVAAQILLSRQQLLCRSSRPSYPVMSLYFAYNTKLLSLRRFNPLYFSLLPFYLENFSSLCNILLRYHRNLENLSRRKWSI